MIISLSGTAGSGKSTVAKLIAIKLGLKEYYMGNLRREMARAKNMTLAEYNAYGETHEETDKEVDEYQKKLGAEEDNFIIQGRTSYYFIPQSIKIYLSVLPDEGARRIWKDISDNPHKRNEAHVNNLDELKQAISHRQQSDIRRYQKYYGINPYDTSHYDVVIDTTHLTPEEVTTQIILNPLIEAGLIQK